MDNFRLQCNLQCYRLLIQQFWTLTKRCHKNLGLANHYKLIKLDHFKLKTEYNQLNPQILNIDIMQTYYLSFKIFARSSKMQTTITIVREHDIKSKITFLFKNRMPRLADVGNQISCKLTNQITLGVSLKPMVNLIFAATSENQILLLI